MEKVFSINNLDCAHCGAKIEEAISKLEGIESAVLNFPMKKLRVRGELSDDMLERMHETARKIEPDVEFVPSAEHSHDHAHHHEHEHHHDHCCDHEHEHEHHHDHCCDHEHEHEHHHDHCCDHEHEHHHEGNRHEFAVENLDCAHCGGKIEEALNKLEGIESAVLNFPMKKFIIKGDVDDKLLARMNEAAC
ncbi:MAG: cation transporter, partial [Ruminococcus sp.]|nr:cation transporter [Ruminococcus sp.]